MRSIDLTFPFLVLGAVTIAVLAPRTQEPSPDEVPLTGTVTDPCADEAVTFGGTADVGVTSRLNGAGGVRVEILADLANGQATGESGTSYELGGTATGEGEATPPLPTTLSIDGGGWIVTRPPADTLAAVIRFQLTVSEDGTVVPTGSAEVLTLECQG